MCLLHVLAIPSAALAFAANPSSPASAVTSADSLTAQTLSPHTVVYEAWRFGQAQSELKR